MQISIPLPHDSNNCQKCFSHRHLGWCYNNSFLNAFSPKEIKSQTSRLLLHRYIILVWDCKSLAEGQSPGEEEVGGNLL
jgi:hypothetical protein